MILSDEDIRRALRAGKIKFDPPIADDQIGPGSVDVTLSNEFFRLKEQKLKVLDAKSTNWADLYEEIKAEAIVLQPGEWVLGKTLERITLPQNMCGWIQTRSRYARIGLAVHIASAFVQPGSDSRQVLEIVNLSKFPTRIYAGMRICQIVIERTETKATRPYAKVGTFAAQ